VVPRRTLPRPRANTLNFNIIFMIYSAGLCYYYMVYTGLIIPWLKDSVISWNYYDIAISDKDGQVVMNITTSLIIRGDNNYRSILLNLLLIFNLQSA
jgi:hypothetical protein